MPWRQRSPEGNVDTVLEELQNDYKRGQRGMVKWMKVKQSLFGDDVSAFTQRIAAWCVNSNAQGSARGPPGPRRRVNVSPRLELGAP